MNLEDLSNKFESSLNEIDLYEHEILTYKSKIDELIRESSQIESEKKELAQSLSVATDSIKKYGEQFNKQKNIYEQKLFRANAKFESLEKKYKYNTKQMKNKEKILLNENQNLKHKITEIEAEKNQIEVQNKIQNISNNNLGLNNNLNSSVMLNNNTMFNLPAVQNNMLNNSFSVNTNNNLGMINNLGTYQTFTYKYDDGDDEKKTLEEFKRILAKIDEKLD